MSEVSFVDKIKKFDDEISRVNLYHVFSSVIDEKGTRDAIENINECVDDMFGLFCEFYKTNIDDVLYNNAKYPIVKCSFNNFVDKFKDFKNFVSSLDNTETTIEKFDENLEQNVDILINTIIREGTNSFGRKTDEQKVNETIDSMKDLLSFIVNSSEERLNIQLNAEYYFNKIDLLAKNRRQIISNYDKRLKELEHLLKYGKTDKRVMKTLLENGIVNGNVIAVAADEEKTNEITKQCYLYIKENERRKKEAENFSKMMFEVNSGLDEIFEYNKSADDPNVNPYANDNVERDWGWGKKNPFLERNKNKNINKNQKKQNQNSNGDLEENYLEEELNNSLAKTENEVDEKLLPRKKVVNSK